MTSSSNFSLKKIQISILFAILFLVLHQIITILSIETYYWSSPSSLSSSSATTSRRNNDGGSIRSKSGSPPRQQQLIWEWHNYSSTTKSTTTALLIDNTNTNHVLLKKPKPKKRLLLGQYSAMGEYSKLLELTAPINKAYSKLWGHDYVTLLGCCTMNIWPRDNINTFLYNENPPERRSRFNKISILQMAIKEAQLHNRYDYLLLMDADAMIYDFNKDITNLEDLHIPIDTEFLIAAHRVDTNDSIETYDVNNGITLWNLHHPYIQNVVNEWYANSKYGLTLQDGKGGDQMYLQRILQKHIERAKNKRIRENVDNNSKKTTTSDYIVYSLQHEFEYRQGTIIKHFIRENIDFSNHKEDANAIWTGNGSSLDVRSTHITNTANETCTKYKYMDENTGIRQSVCYGIEHVEYTKMGA